MITRREVEHVARLARLHFEDEELERLQPELSQIIDYVQQLAELDLSGLEPTSHAVALRNVFRPDVPSIPPQAHIQPPGRILKSTRC